MFGLESVPLDDLQVERSLTPSGSMPLSYSDLLVLAQLAAERGWVVQSVEGYEIDQDSRRLRMDATWRYPHEEYSASPSETARNSSAFMHVVLGDVTDRSDLIYEVWIDPQDDARARG